MRRRVAPDVKRRALVITPSVTGPAIAGDRVVLGYTSRFLRQHFDCQEMTFGRTGALGKVLNVVTGLVPLEVAAYWNSNHKRRLSQRLAQSQFDFIFILHECLFYLADEVDTSRTTVTLFAHNVISLFKSNTHLDILADILARRYVRRWYGKAGARLVLISRGDRAEAVRLGAAKQDAPLASPGAPSASPLDPNAIFSGEMVITGTYGWWRKRRDLRTLGPIDGRIVAFDPLVADAIPGVTILPSVDAVDWKQEIRVGIITDRFSAGFKLKSLEYIARNCLVFSRTPLLDEFQDLPFASEFVVDNLDEREWSNRILMLRSGDQTALRARFMAFKLACLRRYDWSTCLEQLLPPEVSNGIPVGTPDRVRAL